MNISCTENKSNMMEIRKTKFFWINFNTFITNIMEVNIHEKRGRGRSKEINQGNMKKPLSLASYEEMKRLADKREDYSCSDKDLMRNHWTVKKKKKY